MSTQRCSRAWLAAGGALLATLSLALAGAPVHTRPERGRRGCEPAGPVAVEVERGPGWFRIRTTATAPIRGEIRTVLELPAGVELSQGPRAWTGVGERIVRVTGGRPGEPGEVVVRATLPGGERCVARESLDFGPGKARNPVSGGRVTGTGLLKIRGITRSKGGVR